MKKQFTIGIVLLITALTCGCINNNEQEDVLGTDIELNCEPVVVVTSFNYSSDPNSVPYGEIHSIFAQNYTGDDLSIELRDEIIENMIEKANELGENSTILYEAIKVIYYDNWDERPTRIPCYAEKAVYENESVWVIAFNRANGFEGGIDHIDLYFVSIPSIEVQYTSGCNATAIVYHFGCK